MQLSKSVGQGVYGANPADIKMVQMALAAIRDKTYKPYYKGKIDGKAGPLTIDAIARFQADNALKVTGRVDTYGPMLNTLRRKTPHGVQDILAKSGATAGASTGDTVQKMQQAEIKIRKQNEKLVKHIMTDLPLPKEEAKSLVKVIRSCTKNCLVPFDSALAGPVDLSGGRIAIKLKLDESGFDLGGMGSPQGNKIIKHFAQEINKSQMWSFKMVAKTLLISTKHVIQEFKNILELDEEKLTLLGLIKKPKNKIIQAAAANIAMAIMEPERTKNKNISKSLELYKEHVKDSDKTPITGVSKDQCESIQPYEGPLDKYIVIQPDPDVNKGFYYLWKDRVITAMRLYLGTTIGKHMLATLTAREKQLEVTINNRRYQAGKQGGYEIFIDPSYKALTVVRDANGKEIREKTEMVITIAHEVGHAVFDEDDNGVYGTNTIVKYENPVRSELCINLRTRY